MVFFEKLIQWDRFDVWTLLSKVVHHRKISFDDEISIGLTFRLTLGLPFSYNPRFNRLFAALNSPSKPVCVYTCGWPKIKRTQNNTSTALIKRSSVRLSSIHHRGAVFKTSTSGRFGRVSRNLPLRCGELVSHHSSLETENLSVRTGGSGSILIKPKISNFIPRVIPTRPQSDTRLD